MIGQVVLPLADLSLSQDNVFRTDIRPSLKVCMRFYLSQKYGEIGIRLYTELPDNGRLKTVPLVCHVVYLLLERSKGINSIFNRSINLIATCTILVSSVIKLPLPEVRRFA